MKVCKKCEIEKSNESYGKTGNICKECVSKRTKERYHEKRLDPAWVESERNRNREKYHRLNYNKKHRGAYTLEKNRVRKHNYRENFPEKYKAHLAANRLKAKTKGNHLHHWSYNEEHYIDVIELTIEDHRTLHRCTVYDQERKMFRVSKYKHDWAGMLLDSYQLTMAFCIQLDLESAKINI